MTLAVTSTILGIKKSTRRGDMSIITISRFTMSGGERLANCLSAKLGIPAVSREVTTQVADQFAISESFLWEKLEKAKGPSVERNLYLAAVQLALAEKAMEGPFIYHGLAGHFLLRGIPRILKIGIVAPLEMRAKRFMSEKGVSLEEATRSIRRWDEKRIKWVRLLYDVDWLDPSLYDMVLNIQNMSDETACEIVAVALDRDEFKDLPEHRSAIEDFLLASKVRLQIAGGDRTRGIEVDVSAKDRVVRIQARVLIGGMFHWNRGEHARNDLVEVARTVPGVKDVLVSLEETMVPVE
jgi:cytidylate kinase